MSELIIVEKEDITAIADSIREKSVTTEPMTLAGMAEAVLNMSAGSGDLPFNEIFQYTGNALFIDDGEGNYRVKFLTSGTLTVKKDIFVDIFAVGGGGNGGDGEIATQAYMRISGSGGGGGYTQTVRNKKLSVDTEYTVTVGSACGTSSLVNSDGVVLCEAKGGTSGTAVTTPSTRGGDGGSGGCPGSFEYNNPISGSPGSDGNNAIGWEEVGTTNLGYDYAYYGYAGKGQGTTTREFGEPTGDLYAGGGGCGFWATAYSELIEGIDGGAGGGGNGAKLNTSAQNGGENTGGGGGGGGYNGASDLNASYTTAGKGGSGIVIIRNFRAVTA